MKSDRRLFADKIEQAGWSDPDRQSAGLLIAAGPADCKGALIVLKPQLPLHPHPYPASCTDIACHWHTSATQNILL